jgi:Ni/Fe-hydrogenase subunit HybB-like protein
MILVLQLSHFTTAVICAFCASLVFGITQRNEPRDMVRYGIYCFIIFIFVGLFAGGWLMWLLHH